MTASEALEELWHRKYLALPVLVLAVVAAIFVAGRGFTVYRASTDILLDTPRSQAVDIGTKGEQNDTVPEIDILATRARLLGNLMASGPVEQAIARRAGVDADRLIVVPPPDAEADESSLASKSSEDAAKADAIALTVTTDSTLPIIRVVGQAPDESTANRLVAGASRELEDYLGSVAADDDVPEIQRLEVDSIGLYPAVAQSGGPGAVAAILAALLVLAVGWGGIVVVSRALAERAAHGIEPLAIDDLEEEGGREATVELTAKGKTSRALNGSGDPAPAPSPPAGH
jgi:hypothetical protein